jgi:hypothetical protein
MCTQSWSVEPGSVNSVEIRVRGGAQRTWCSAELRGKLTAGWTFQHQLYELKATRGVSPQLLSYEDDDGEVLKYCRPR